MFGLSPFGKMKKELARLYREKSKLEDKLGDGAFTKDEMKAAIAGIDEFIEGPYAQSVFEYYSKKKPKLIRIKTSEVVEWEDAFGSSFSKTTKTQKHALVGLVEGGSMYKLK